MDDVLTALRAELEADRADGLDFDEAWPGAVRAALYDLGTTERRGWVTVLLGTEEGWRAAFDRMPASPAERAVEMVAADERGIPIPFGTCELCDAPLPEAQGAGSTRTYCSDECRSTAQYLAAA